jgi:hypothetical protein
LFREVTGGARSQNGGGVCAQEPADFFQGRALDQLYLAVKQALDNLVHEIGVEVAA